jgi:hypothetical protein
MFINKNLNRMCRGLLSIAMAGLLWAILADRAVLGGGGSSIGGTIYFRWGGWLAAMNSDGSSKSSSSLPVGEPSRGLPGGHRWFLRGEPVPNEFYPDGVQRCELFAFRDDGIMSVQLTNEPTLEFAIHGYGYETIRWQPGDHSISWIACEWDLLSGQIVACGIYEAVLLFDNAGNVAGLDPLSLDLIVPEADIGTHDWAPDGTAIVYDRPSTGELRIADPATGQSVLLYAGPAAVPVWSPGGAKIAFSIPQQWGGIGTVNVDGSNPRTIISGRGGKQHVWVRGPLWSPTGAYLIYLHETGDVLGGTFQSDVYRARADGSQPAILTGDTGASAIPIAWR